MDPPDPRPGSLPVRHASQPGLHPRRQPPRRHHRKVPSQEEMVGPIRQRLHHLSQSRRADPAALAGRRPRRPGPGEPVPGGQACLGSPALGHGHAEERRRVQHRPDCRLQVVRPAARRVRPHHRLPPGQQPSQPADRGRPWRGGEELEQGAAPGRCGGEAAAGEGAGAVGGGRRLGPGVGGDQVVFDGEVGRAPGGDQVDPAAGTGRREPGVGLRAQAEGALAERPPDGEDARLDQEVDQQGELLVGEVEIAGEAAEVADGHGPGPDQRQGLPVEAGADALGGDHGPGGGGRRPRGAVGRAGRGSRPGVAPAMTGTPGRREGRARPPSGPPAGCR